MKLPELLSGLERHTSIGETLLDLLNIKSNFSHSPLITILEDRGVEKKAFLKLQEQAISEIEMSSDTVSSMADLFKKHQLGSRFRLPNILSCLAAVNMRTPKEARDAEHVLKDPFFDRLIYTAKYALLRDIKFTARIPIKEGYHIVGVADEGPTYRVPEDEVYKLKEGEIFCKYLIPHYVKQLDR